MPPKRRDPGLVSAAKNATKRVIAFGCTYHAPKITPEPVAAEPTPEPALPEPALPEAKRECSIELLSTRPEDYLPGGAATERKMKRREAQDPAQEAQQSPKPKPEPKRKPSVSTQLLSTCPKDYLPSARGLGWAEDEIQTTTDGFTTFDPKYATLSTDAVQHLTSQSKYKSMRPSDYINPRCLLPPSQYLPEPKGPPSRGLPTNFEVVGRRGSRVTFDLNPDGRVQLRRNSVVTRRSSVHSVVSVPENKYAFSWKSVHPADCEYSEESRQEAEELVRALDLNQDGILTAQELMGRLSDQGFPDETVEAIVFRVDQNEDGEISVDELQEAIPWLKSLKIIPDY